MIKNYHLKDKKGTLNTATKIFVASDFHVKGPGDQKRLQYVKDDIEEYCPDLVILNGDLQNSDAQENPELLDTISTIAHKTQTVITIGNHELMKRREVSWIKSSYEQWVEILSKISGVTVLHNKALEIGNLRLIGYTTPFEYYEGNTEMKREDGEYLQTEINSTYLNSFPEDKYNIFIAHYLGKAIENRRKIEVLKTVNLLLGSHEHGNCVPPIVDKIIGGHWGIIKDYNLKELEFFKKYCRGKMTLEEQEIITTLAVKTFSPDILDKFLGWLYPPCITHIEIEPEKTKKLG